MKDNSNAFKIFLFRRELKDGQYIGKINDISDYKLK
jgi:hypothetical protein